VVLLATSGVPQDASAPARVWACGRGGGVYGVLSGLGVAVELREYTTVVKGRAYRRCLVLVRDLKLLERVVRAARRGELAKLVRKGWRAAAEALEEGRVVFTPLLEPTDIPPFVEGRAGLYP